jgi:hypothetical protein
VQWCTVSVGGSTQRYGLYRTISGACDASDAVFQVDHVTKPDIWSTSCSSVHLQTVSVDLPVNRDIVNHPERTYELTDAISLRNDSVSSGNCS